jgi:hypothetical protein
MVTGMDSFLPSCAGRTPTEQVFKCSRHSIEVRGISLRIHTYGSSVAPDIQFGVPRNDNARQLVNALVERGVSFYGDW